MHSHVPPDEAKQCKAKNRSGGNDSVKSVLVLWDIASVNFMSSILNFSFLRKLEFLVIKRPEEASEKDIKV